MIVKINGMAIHQLQLYTIKIEQCHVSTIKYASLTTLDNLKYYTLIISGAFKRFNKQLKQYFKYFKHVTPLFISYLSVLYSGARTIYRTSKTLPISALKTMQFVISKIHISSNDST